MADYFPDSYPKGRSCNREYFFTVLASLHPTYCDDLVKKSKKDRFGKLEGVEKGEAIAITADWEQQLKEFPQFTRKSLYSRNTYLVFLTKGLAAGCWL